MGKWAGKYVIGLTGNIATGKSLVRRMLEHLGALGIDADLVAHRAISPAAPGYQPVVSMFGRYILSPSGEIDRSKLARIVFSDPRALAVLEEIIHPLVSQAVDLIISRTTRQVVVIEAIKLLEAGLGEDCDSIWVTYALPEVQLQRLVQTRGLSQADASQRISAQPPQEEKIAAAQVVIHNDSTPEETWRQVSAAWSKLIVITGAPTGASHSSQAAFSVIRAAPQHAARIAEFINHVSQPSPVKTSANVLADFGEKAYLLLLSSGTVTGLLGWQVENLVARISDVILAPTTSLESALPLLVAEMERASRELQCEAALIFASPALARHDTLWKSLGYTVRNPQSLEISAWAQAALESMPLGTVLLFKQLRADRILLPI